MKKQILALLFVSSLILVCLLPQNALAARSITITSDRNSLFGSDEMNISASISGFTNGEKIYLKGAFFKDGSTNYFGYTKSGDSWIKNSTTATDQRVVEIGNWDTNTIVRSDFNDSGYTGKGDYKFKLGYYYLTSGGNLSSVNWSANTLSLTLDAPAPTQAPTQTTSQTTSSTSKTASIKTNTPTKTPTQAKTNSTLTNVSNSAGASGQTRSVSDKIAQNFKIATDFARIRNVTPTKARSPEDIRVLGAKEQAIPPLGLITIIGGLFLFLSAGAWFAYKNLDQIKIWIGKY